MKHGGGSKPDRLPVQLRKVSGGGEDDLKDCSEWEDTIASWQVLPMGLSESPFLSCIKLLVGQ
jgi:hypothetical protein